MDFDIIRTTSRSDFDDIRYRSDKLLLKKMTALAVLLSHKFDEEIKLVDNLTFREPHIHLVRVQRRRFLPDSEMELVKVYGGFASGRVNYILYDERIENRVLWHIKRYAEPFGITKIAQHISTPFARGYELVKGKKVHLRAVE